DVLALNEEEARALSGLELDPDRPEPILDACARAAPGARLVITAGAAGAIGFEEGRWARRRPPAVRAVSAAGAGDALLAGVLAATAAGVPFLPAEDDDAPHSSGRRARAPARARPHDGAPGGSPAGRRHRKG